MGVLPWEGAHGSYARDAGVSSTWSDAANTISSPGFTLYDAAIHYEWERFRFAVNVQNVEDKVVQASCFLRNRLLCTFGEARTVRGSVTYRW